MRKLPKLSHKHSIVYTLALILLLVILPLISIKLFPKALKLEEAPAEKVDIPKTVDLYITKSEKTITLDFEEYIKGVVASEMPSSFDIEALKAQSVASRTYALGRILAGDKLCDSTHCQVYRSDNIDDKVAKAVETTRGQLLYYEGGLASHTLYFASSGGKTENSEDVFQSPYPYLKSVKSPYEQQATHQKEKLTMTIDQFSKTIKEAFPRNAFGTIDKSNIKILARSSGGRISQIKVGDVTLSGTDIRSALGLYSTLFTIDISGDKMTITSSGSGHGVGMSQYGANGYALKGFTYKEILGHYYEGTLVY